MRKGILISSLAGGTVGLILGSLGISFLNGFRDTAIIVVCCGSIGVITHFALPRSR